MGRHSLRVILVAGLLITAMGGTGIFAVFSDRATTGSNSVTSGSRPRAADLQINIGLETPTGTDCQQDLDSNGTVWTDDLTTGVFAVPSMQPGESATAMAAGMPAGAGVLCLKNAGAANLDVTASVIDVVDLDVACTGDELAAGDATCGVDATTLAPQLGELSPLLTLTTGVDMGCQGQYQGSTTSLASTTNQPVTYPAGTALAPGQIVCLSYSVTYPLDTPEASVQLAQSDQVTWRFAFDGTAP